jgi:hypothetical protein
MVRSHPSRHIAPGCASLTRATYGVAASLLARGDAPNLASASTMRVAVRFAYPGYT